MGSGVSDDYRANVGLLRGYLIQEVIMKWSEALVKA
jgi:hypothetical protein